MQSAYRVLYSLRHLFNIVSVNTKVIIINRPKSTLTLWSLTKCVTCSGWLKFFLLPHLPVLSNRYSYAMLSRVPSAFFDTTFRRHQFFFYHSTSVYMFPLHIGKQRRHVIQFVSSLFSFTWNAPQFSSATLPKALLFYISTERTLSNFNCRA